MTLWHLAWMHLALLLTLALLVTTPFAWWYAIEYCSGERARRRRALFRVLAAWREQNGLEPCLYCGIWCSGAEGCTNRERLGGAS